MFDTAAETLGLIPEELFAELRDCRHILAKRNCESRFTPTGEESQHDDDHCPNSRQRQQLVKAGRNDQR